MEDILGNMRLSLYSLIPNSPTIYTLLEHEKYSLSDNLTITEVYCITSSYKEQGSLLCIPVKAESHCLLFWRFEYDILKDIQIVRIFYPKQDFTSLQAKFSFEEGKFEHLCIYTESFFIYGEYSNGSFTKFFTHIEENGKIYDACFLDDGKWGVVTDTFLLIFNLSDERIEYKLDLLRPSSVITGIRSLNDSLILMGKNKRLEYWQNDRDYKCVFSTMFEGYSNFDIINVAFPADSVNVDYIIISTNQNDVYKMDLNEYLSNSDKVIKEENNLEEERIKEMKKRDKNSLKYILPSFHTDSIEALDVCINKPYFISGSKDRSLRVYDFKNKKLHLQKTFNEDILSVAYHPSGNYAILSFEERLRPINIFYDDIQNMTQNGILSRKSKDLKFSNGGHLFAFDAGNRVEVWNFLTLQLHQGLKFAFSTSRVNFKIN